MSEPRIIKKYPNRRLYDTAISRYITLADIRQLVVEHAEFKVIDKQSQTDITETILLQVIAEGETADRSLFTRSFLASAIRNQDEPLRLVARQFLDQSMNLFSNQERALRNLCIAAKNNGREISDIAGESLSKFRSVQQEVFKRLNASAQASENQKS